MGVRSLVVAGTAAICSPAWSSRFSRRSICPRFGADLYVGPLVGPVRPARARAGAHRDPGRRQGRRPGITAELGSMKVTEQIDALRRDRRELHQASDRAARPRRPLRLPLLTALRRLRRPRSAACSIAVFERRIDVYLYWNTIFYWVVIRDLVTGVGKSFFFGSHRHPDRRPQRSRHDRGNGRPRSRDHRYGRAGLGGGHRGGLLLTKLFLLL